MNAGADLGYLRVIRCLQAYTRLASTGMLKNVSEMTSKIVLTALRTLVCVCHSGFCDVTLCWAVHGIHLCGDDLLLRSDGGPSAYLRLLCVDGHGQYQLLPDVLLVSRRVL